MTHLYIITGSSRGLGRAIAKQLAIAGHLVVGIARQQNLELASLEVKYPVAQWKADLADAQDIAQQLEQYLTSALVSTQEPITSVTLINNAAYLAEPASLGAQVNADIVHAIEVGLTAPLLLCNAFLRATQSASIPKSIVNISSGLGRRAMAGSTSYCAIKAGMDHFSRAIDLEQQEMKYPARVCSLAPGVIDTDMQVQLRGASPEAFSSRQNFQDLKDKGQLDAPDAAAAKIIAYIARKNFGMQVIADVRDPE
jgi:benzil reductase ((S)-benzoin forming)